MTRRENNQEGIKNLSEKKEAKTPAFICLTSVFGIYSNLRKIPFKLTHFVLGKISLNSFRSLLFS